MSLNEKLNQKFDKEVNDNTHVNIMVVGGTGVGKSSLVNTVFGKEVAPVGSGEPITKGIEKYQHPHIPVVIFDTEGYEIIDGKIDNNNFETVVINEITKRQKRPLKEQIHLFWYCISAANHRITEYDLNNIKKLTVLGINLAIVITKCDTEEIDANGQGLVSLSFKKVLSENNIKNTVYETMITAEENDNLELNKLLEWSSQSLCDENLRRAFIGAQKKNMPLKNQEASNIINISSGLAAAAAGLNPLPLSDALLLAPIQMGMTVQLAKLYGFDSLGQHAMTLLKTQLISMLGKQMATSLTKLIPFVGQFVNAGVASGLTWSLGYALNKMYYSAYEAYLDTGKEPDWVNLFSMLDLTSILKNIKK